MELTARLQSVANQVPQGALFADIGTDHAYLPVWLLLNGRIDHAIAADLREGPLNRARETAAQYNQNENIEFRLCNGLTGIEPDEADTIAIAGMGGETITSILEVAPWTKNDKLLLLQPMTSFPDLRFWLQQNGYYIEKECISREGKRLYSCLTVRAGAMDELTPAELWVGKQNHDPLRKDFLSMMAEKVERALNGKRSALDQDLDEIEYLQQVLTGIRNMEGDVSQ